MSAAAQLPSPIRWAGSKVRIAPWVVRHFPQHDCYVEPFFGGGSILFAKERAGVEIINDLDDLLVNFWQVVRDQPLALAAALATTPYAQEEYDRAIEIDRAAPDAFSPVERARALVVLSQQRFGGKTVHHRSGWRIRDTKGQSPLGRWLALPDNVMACAERLQGLQISKRDALSVIERSRGRETLLYCDPPYPATTRTANGQKLYAHELRSEADHRALLATLQAHDGMVVLSSYPSALYDGLLDGWAVYDVSARAQSNEKRTERLYLNPRAARRLLSVQGRLEYL